MENGSIHNGQNSQTHPHLTLVDIYSFLELRHCKEFISLIKFDNNYEKELQNFMFNNVKGIWKLLSFANAIIQQ